MKYTSIFSPDKKVSNAQYIIELVCQNRAKSLNITLPIKPWDFEEWRLFYQSQLKKVHIFLKTYSAETLIKVIRDKNIFSLHAKWIIEEFNKEKVRSESIVIPDIEHERILDSKGIQKKEKDFSQFD